MNHNLFERVTITLMEPPRTILHLQTSQRSFTQNIVHYRGSELN